MRYATCLPQPLRTSIQEIGLKFMCNAQKPFHVSRVKLVSEPGDVTEPNPESRAQKSAWGMCVGGVGSRATSALVPRAAASRAEDLDPLVRIVGEGPAASTEDALGQLVVRLVWDAKEWATLGEAGLRASASHVPLAGLALRSRVLSAYQRQPGQPQEAEAASCGGPRGTLSTACLPCPRGRMRRAR